MISFPENMVEIARAASKRHPNDIEAAAEDAEAKIRKCPEFKEVIDTFVKHSIRDMIHAARHAGNVAIKRQSGYYGQRSDIHDGSAAVNKVYRSVYDYSIASTTLGELKGSELNTIEQNEAAMVDGHRFNVELMQWLKAQNIPDDKTVRQSVKHRKLAENFNRIKKEVYQLAEAGH